MYPAERQSEILRIAHDNGGAVSVTALAEQLDVASETVRRDLDVLERQGRVTRHRGGAALVGRAPFEAALARRLDEDRGEKEAIAERILGMLPDDGVVLLDSGSTTQALAERFPDRELTVVTNNLPTVPELARRSRLTVFALPGRVRPVTQGVADVWTWRRLERLRGDVAVLGANGLTAGGATTTVPEEAAVKAAMVRAARYRVLAVTSAKMGRESFCHYADLADFDAVVTGGVPDELAADIRAAGPELFIV